MSAAVFIRSSKNDFPVERALIFIAFLFGALSAVYDLFDLPALPPPRVLFSFFLGSILLFAASGFGLFLLPVEMLLFGHFSQTAVLSTLLNVTGNISQEPKTFLFSTLLVPLVFLASFHGICAASSLRTVLFRVSPTAKTLYQSELTKTSLLVLLALSVVFCFT